MKSMLHTMLMSVLLLDWRDVLKTFWMACHGITRAFVHRKKTVHLAALRLGVCDSCVFFNRRWRTCGTPGEVTPAVCTEDGTYIPPQKIGCWCFLPLAVKDPKKDCYARMNNLDVGWPDELRPVDSRGK